MAKKNKNHQFVQIVMNPRHDKANLIYALDIEGKVWKNNDGEWKVILHSKELNA